MRSVLIMYTKYIKIFMLDFLLTQEHMNTIFPIKDPFLYKISFPFFKDLDLELLNIGSNFFIGKKDFSSFCKSKSDVNNKICNVTEAFWIKKQYVYF